MRALGVAACLAVLLLASCESTDEPAITEQPAWAAMPEPDPEAVRLLEADIHALRGDSHSLEGRYDEAEAEYAEAFANSPGHPNAVVGLARIRLKQNRIEDARQMLNELLARKPDMLLAWQHLAAIRWQIDGDLEGALTAIERMLQIEPNHAKALHWKKNLEKALAERKQGSGS